MARYLTGRGLNTVPPVLAGHPALPYADNGQFQGCYPAMVAPVIGPDGRLQSCLRTYVADVLVRKKMMPPADSIRGATVRLFEPSDILGIAEGIETAIAANELFGIPTWAVLSTSGMEAFQPPAAVRQVKIYADNDRNFAGQKAAYVLAQRLGRDVAVEVATSSKPDTDWLDVLNDRVAGDVARIA